MRRVDPEDVILVPVDSQTGRDESVTDPFPFLDPEDVEDPFRFERGRRRCY